MGINRKGRIAISYLVFFSLLTQLHANSSPSVHEIKVGLILDMGSWTGKTVHSCISMAISDFYASNSHYRTRIVLHARNSKGELLQAISAALDLLENVKVQTIMGPEEHLEAKFLAALGEKYEVPYFSLSSMVSSPGKYSFLVQIKRDETIQFKGIASMLKSYNWRNVNFICEDSDEGRDILPYILDTFQEANVHITYRSIISPFSTDDQILSELHKLMSGQTTINVVHLSPSLASRLFISAKRLGMMEKGYAWILTDKIMNVLHTLDPQVIESLHGALGFKAHIPASRKLFDIILRWMKEFHSKKDPMTTALITELDALSIWAYDTVLALAESSERVFIDSGKECSGLSFRDSANTSASQWGRRLLREIAGTRLAGLSGEFQFLNGKLQSETYVIVNVIGKRERSVGFWTSKEGLVKEIQPIVTERDLSTRRGLEAIVWPGFSTTVPKGWPMLTSGKKLRIGVPNQRGFKELVNVYHDPQTNTKIFTGFCIKVFEAAIKSLDYEVPYEFIPFVNEEGENLGSYTDLIDQVYFQKYDGAVGDITITANRSLYVDFTSPYTDSGAGTIARRQTGDMWVFSKPLNAELWLTSAAFFVLMGSVVWAIEHRTNEAFQGSISQQIGTILWFGFSTLVYAHREKLTSNLSRFAVIIWLFVVLILTSSYTATLSSMLTLQQIKLASVGEHVGVQRGSFLGGSIASNMDFVDDRLRLYIFPQQYADALSKGRKKGGAGAIVDEIPYIKIFLSKYGADFAMVETASTISGFGFAFQKGSPLVSDLSQAILKMREEGTLEMMEKKWFKIQTSFIPEGVAAEPNILSIQSFGGLFLVSLVSFLAALLLHLLFVLLEKLQSKKIIIKLFDGGKLAVLLRFLAPRNENVIELVHRRNAADL